MTPAAVSIVPAQSALEISRCYEIRRQVFVLEQAVPPAIEWDQDDAHALHVLALNRDRAVGCARSVAHGDRVKLGRMAVLADYRRRGIGSLLLNYLLQDARSRGFKLAYLHAQLRAEEFYRRAGFTPSGDVFEEAGITHRLMQLGL